MHSKMWLSTRIHWIWTKKLLKTIHFTMYFSFLLCVILTAWRWGFATKYRIDIPVHDNNTCLHNLLEHQSYWRGKPIEGLKCLLVTPLSFQQSYRCRDEGIRFADIGESLLELALPLRTLATTASGKERWWTTELLKLCPASMNQWS